MDYSKTHDQARYWPIKGSIKGQNAYLPRVYFARAMDELKEADILKLSKIVQHELSQYDLKMIDPYIESRAFLQQQKILLDNQSKIIVDYDLGLLRKCDAVLMDLSIPLRSYIGCICELVYAFTWKIPVAVYVGQSGNDLRHWLRYHATIICHNRDDAITALANIFRGDETS